MDNYTKFEEIIERYNLSASEVLNLLTDWHSTSIISNDFLENLADCEGYS